MTGWLLAAQPYPLAAQGPGEGMTLAQGQVLRGRFEQERFLQGFAGPLKSAGSFVLAPGRGLIWRAEKPFALTTVISPAGLVQEAGGRETMRLSAARMPVMGKLYTMLSGALSGNWSELETAFSVKRKGDAKKGWELHLTPLETDNSAVPIRTVIAKGARLVEQVEVVKPDGDRDRLVFSGQKLETAPLSPEEAKLLDAAGQL